MGHPQDGKFEKKRDKGGHLSSRHDGSGSKEALRDFLYPPTHPPTHPPIRLWPLK